MATVDDAAAETQSSEPEDEREFLAGQLQAQLNQHGLAFQYRVIKAAQDAGPREPLPPNWCFEAAEYPAQLRGKPTHIDFILRNTKRPLYLVCECKRVNPAFSTWFFFRAPYTRRDIVEDNALFLETLRKPSGSGTFYAPPTICRLGQQQTGSSYDLAIVAKTREKGDSGSKDTLEVINNAASQVCLGMAGLFEQWAERAIPGEKDISLYFLPVIITTARLFGCAADLTSTDLETGNISVDPATLVEKPWVFLQHPRSPGVCPNVTPTPLRELGFRRDDICERPYIRLGDYRDVAFLRTIAIVSAARFGDFLSTFPFQFSTFAPLSIVEPVDAAGRSPEEGVSDVG